MPNYRRNYVQGGTYFLTLTLQDRTQTYLTDYIGELRSSFSEAKKILPFEITAICILPDHLHLLMTLPENDSDFSRRIRAVKYNFSKKIPISQKIWQNRFWEHTIRDDRDLENHIAYTYYNPVKHGYCAAVSDWMYSSFHRDVRNGLFPKSWAGDLSEKIMDLYRE